MTKPPNPIAFLNASKHLGHKILGFQLGELISCFLIIFFTLTIRKLFIGFIFKKIKKIKGRKLKYYKDAFHSIEQPISFFVVATGIFTGISVLSIPEIRQEAVANMYKASSIFIAAWGLSNLTSILCNFLKNKFTKTQSSIAGFVPLFQRTIRIFIITIGVLMGIQNLGYSVSGILTTLGIGGAAIAFASKDTIANFFGSLSIVADRPFKIGDWIQVGTDVDGVVESIGLRSTRIRTFPKTLMSIPNSVLANDRIDNWSRMPKRRVKQFISLTYETTQEEIDLVVKDIRKTLQEDDSINQEFILVNFTDFSDCSLDILVYYFTTTTDWIEHMNVRQRINGKIMKLIKARGLAFAFPTNTIYFEGDIARKMAGNHNVKGSSSDYPK